MHEGIIQYLQQNKNNLSKEELINKLKQFGYNDNEINNAIGYVYEGKDLRSNILPNTLDTQSKDNNVNKVPSVDKSAQLQKTHQNTQHKGMSVGSKIALVVIVIAIIITVGIITAVIVKTSI
jgi:uncharacterized protein Smg (DUF494 family)